MSKHSPGPWHVHWGDKVWRGPNVDGERTFVCETWGETHGEAAANAHLVSHAPEMYDAIKQFLSDGEIDPLRELFNRIRDGRSVPTPCGFLPGCG